MTSTGILYIILGILTVDFILERFLEYLNHQKWSPILPKALEGIYDQEKYHQSQNYQKDKLMPSLLSSSIGFVATVLMIALGGFAWVDELARNYFDHPIAIALAFFGVIMFFSSILGLPFSYYSTFVIEEKYGFNRTSLKTFVLDKLKGGLLSIVIGGGILALIIWIYLQTTTNFWWMAWLVIAFFMIFMAMFYSSLLVPLFNKQTPLEEGELKDEISKFAGKVGFKLDNVYVMNGSKRSSKGNAYFSGFGSKKRIVLFDTLINDLSKEEIVAVLAHEIGHYKKKHTLSGILLSLLQTGFMFYIFSLIISNPLLSEALGAKQHGFHLGLIAFGILYSPISTFLGLGMNLLSRKNEYEADDYALKNYDGKALGNALKKLSVSSLSNLTPHPVYVFFYYSHPSLLQRLKALQLIK
ncbi:M48 family metallopeptidase [Labilibaculum antarcticum]|uniref:Peptidase M48 n=1 Tax=Labilibaculum antarcticum TaxID=1717717 RepID=A0A1Y1CP47_9BACT|nr:M48 family metallopeptidase [Labilibaculum antarcticum]BAX82187.1 peptidase M48 [Labilibaculum antarcticum]